MTELESRFEKTTDFETQYAIGVEMQRIFERALRFLCSQPLLGVKVIPRGLVAFQAKTIPTPDSPQIILQKPFWC